MDDDLNTAQALGYLFETVRLLNRLLEAPSADPGYLTILTEMHHELVDLGGVLNLLQADPSTMVATLRQKAADLKITPGRNPTAHRRPHPGPEGQGLGPS